jgi:hypothetical protein
MTNGNDLTGFNEVKAPTVSDWNGEQYAADPASSFPKSDVSNQATAEGPK